MKINRFEDLQIWQESTQLTKEVYSLTKKKPMSSDMGICWQIQRAVVSISSNIVEGFERANNNEFIRYLKIAKGSLGEVRNQLYLAYIVKYINEKTFKEFTNKTLLLSRQIGGFISYLENKRKKGEFIKK